ncbi:hypothetical protein V6N13_009831 [Hibiscus sabdariffa]
MPEVERMVRKEGNRESGDQDQKPNIQRKVTDVNQGLTQEEDDLVTRKENKEKVISLFVENIPDGMQWKGHVNNEDLWKLRRCLVGETASVCSLSSIRNRLVSWGLGDVKVQRLGAKAFLLTIEDEDLFMLLEELDWSYLKEIFYSVKPWSEKTSYTERATWLEIRGLPIHCWNHASIKKIAELWGSFEALGANANHSLDCEKVTVLITTKLLNKVEETIEMEIGSSSDSESKVDGQGAVGDGRSISGSELEAINVLCAEKDFNNRDHREQANLGSKIYEENLVGEGPESRNVTIQIQKKEGVLNYRDAVEESSGVGDSDKDKGGPTYGPKRNIDYGANIGDMDQAEQVLDVTGHGVNPVLGEKAQVSWADRIDHLVNAEHGLSPGDEGGARELGENEVDFYSEIEGIKRKKRGKKSRKFGSMIEMQNKVIFENERIIRDKALRNGSVGKKALKKSELSGRSLSDSDIKARVSTLVNEARQIVKLGKKIGVQIVGNEDDVIQELVLLESGKGV